MDQLLLYQRFSMQMLRCSIDIMLFFFNERGSGWNDESIKDTFPDGQLLEGQLQRMGMALLEYLEHRTLMYNSVSE